jgi:hypothetical protein
MQWKRFGLLTISKRSSSRFVDSGYPYLKWVCPLT